MVKWDDNTVNSQWKDEGKDRTTQKALLTKFRQFLEIFR